MIKVEKNYNKQTGVTFFAFECNSKDDHETLDALRVFILGNHTRRGGYANGYRLVIEAKIPVDEPIGG